VKERSSLLARILAGSWRREPPPLAASDAELTEVTPLLIGSGAAALALRRLRDYRLEGPALDELRQASRLQILQAAIHHRSIVKAFQEARARGVEPILLKGWAVARLYAEAWLRPPGDLDFLVRPNQRAAAEAALLAPDSGVLSVVDLKHKGFDDLTPSAWELLYKRSEVVTLEGSMVRVLGAEDQFRFLCEHLWKHSAYRPVWLCDVAAALEAIPPDFDWDLCLGRGDRLTVNRVGCAVGVARLLLGADAAYLPGEVRSVKLPRWLTTEVLRQWETPCTEHHLPRELMAASLRRPSRVLPALFARWPDPIRAAVGMGAELDEAVRLPRQLMFYLYRASRFLMSR
jgi:hypothetical protein